MKRLSIVALALLACCFLFLGFLAYLPTWISTPQGKDWLIDRLNRSIRGHVSCEAIQLSWFGAQRMDHISIEDQEGKQLLSVDHVGMELGLFDLFNPKRCIPQLMLDHPSLVLERTHHPHFSLREVFTTSPTVTPACLLLRGWGWRSWLCLGSIHIVDGSISMASPQLKPVTLRNINLDYKKDPDTIHFELITDQEGVQGKCSGSGSIAGSAELAISLRQCPLGIADQWRGDSLVTSLLGETVDGSITTTGGSSPLSVHLNLKTKQLSGSMQATLAHQAWDIVPGASFRYEMTPTGFHSLLGSEQQKEWKSNHTINCILSINQGTLPLSPKLWSLDTVQIESTLILERIQLFHTLSGVYELSNFKANAKVHQGIQIQSSGLIQNHHIEGTIHLDGSFSAKQEGSFHLISDHFPVLFLGIVFDQADLVHSSVGPWLSVDIQGAYRPGDTEASLSFHSDRTYLHGSVYGKHMDALRFTLEGERVMEESWAPFIGHSISTRLQGKAAIWDRNLIFTTLSGAIESDHLSMEVSGRLGEKNKPFSGDAMQIIAQGKILALPYQEQSLPASLEHGSFVITLDGKENALLGRGELTISVPDGEEVYLSKQSTFDFTIRDVLGEEAWQLDEAYVEASVHMNHLPSQLFTPLFPNSLPPELLFGPNLDLQCQFTYNHPANPHHWEFDCEALSRSLQAKLLLIGNQEIILSKGNKNSIRLQLQDYQVAQLWQSLWPNSSLSSWELVHPVEFHCFIEKLHCPLQAFADHKLWAMAGMEVAYSCSPVVYKRDDEILVFDHMHGSISSQELQDSTTVSFSSSLRGSNLPTHESSYLSLQATVSRLWQDHEWKWNRASIDGSCEAHHIPMRQILDLLPLSPATMTGYQALIGDFLSAYGSINLINGEGHIDLEIQASHGHVMCPLQCTSSGFLLRAPLQGSLRLTEELAEWLLIDVNPLFITGAYSATPITFQIDPDGFFFPLHPFTFKGIRVPHAILDIGQIQVRNGGQIQSLMEFLKADDITEDQWMEAWCTPIYMSLEEGTSHYERFDLLLARAVHIALWGRIDLVKNKVKMILGIDPTTLAKRFRVHGLGSSDMFQVKMKGPANDVELDWSSAYTRIGIIIARLTGGNLIYLVGGVLDQILSVLGEEATPPPTTQPLPWDLPYQK